MSGEGESGFGRPKKLKDGRSSVTAYLDNGLLRKVDDRVFHAKQDNRSYSRSDFLNQALEYYLAELEKGDEQDGKQDP